ncbi:MAG TPA: ISAs1 family transposase [Vicinamibacteria bacterium]|nr:ISAs1 family transposase [Vicinamibacteria bacterium]
MKHLARKAVPAATASPAGSLAEALAQVPEPRRPYGWRAEHAPLPLVALLQLTVAATLCGARSLYAIAQWGEDRRQDHPGLLEALGLPPGRRPCVATLHRVFKRLDVAAFEAALGAWLQRTGVSPTDPIAVDGKTLRGIHGEEIPGVHLVSAYTHAAGAILAQLQTAGKGQELAAAKTVLAEVPLAGRLVTTDALLTQREIAQQVVDGGGSYLLPVKDNQPSLHADLHAAFSPLEGDRR